MLPPLQVLSYSPSLLLAAQELYSSFWVSDAWAVPAAIGFACAKGFAGSGAGGWWQNRPGTFPKTTLGRHLGRVQDVRCIRVFIHQLPLQDRLIYGCMLKFGYEIVCGLGCQHAGSQTNGETLWRNFEGTFTLRNSIAQFKFSWFTLLCHPCGIA